MHGEWYLKRESSPIQITINKIIKLVLNENKHFMSHPATLAVTKQTTYKTMTYI